MNNDHTVFVVQADIPDLVSMSCLPQTLCLNCWELFVGCGRYLAYHPHLSTCKMGRFQLVHMRAERDPKVHLGQTALLTEDKKRKLRIDILVWDRTRTATSW